MARPAFTDIADTDIDQDSPITETLLEDIRDNAEALRITPIYVGFSEATSTTATPGAKIHEFPLHIPNLADYTSIQRQVTVWMQVKYATGTSASFYLKDNATSNTGTAVTTTSTSYEVKEPSLNIDAGWINTTRVIEIWAYPTGGGTAYAQADDSYGSRMEY